MSNFTSGWVQLRTRRETGDSKAVTSVQEHYFFYFSIPKLFFEQRKKSVWMKIRMGLLNTQNEIIEKLRNRKTKRSCIDVTALLSLVSRLAR